MGIFFPLFPKKVGRYKKYVDLGILSLFGGIFRDGETREKSKGKNVMQGSKNIWHGRILHFGAAVSKKKKSGF